MNPFQNSTLDAKIEAKTTESTDNTENANEKVWHIPFQDKKRLMASIFDKISTDFVQFSVLRSNVPDPQTMNFPEIPTFHKFDTAIKINSATNTYIFMNSVPLQASKKMKEWFQEQQKQESTKNNKFFTMDLSTFGENNVKLVLKALLAGEFDKGLRHDHLVAKLVENFDIAYLNRRYNEATRGSGFVHKKRNFSNNSKNNRYNNRNHKNRR